MAEVENLCDHLVILNNGNIAFCGTATELTDNIEDTLMSLFNDLKQKDIHILDIKVGRGTLEQHFIEMARRETE